MNNTTLFVSPLENTQFFSIINSIIVLGDILYNDKQLVTNKKVEPIPIINVLCKFLKENSQKKEEILILGHRLLEKTDLYGAKKNESISLSFVNAMLNNIIANTVFSKYGNTFGYLSSIVNSTSDLRLSSVKRKIIKNLQRQKFINDNGTTYTLSNTTISRITEKIIFPLFPEPKKDMEIVNIKYIYAQAGLILLGKAQENTGDISFLKLISLAQSVEQGVLQGEIDPSALQIFQLPALLYYTHKKEHGIKRKTLKFIMISTTFWHHVYSRFFTDLNVTFEKIIFLQKQNPVYHFQMAFAKFKTRTVMAEEIIRKNCHNETDIESALIDYKNNPEEYYCNRQLQPDINEMFFSQNRIIAEKYYYYEKHLISQVFDEDLKKFIDLKNVTIKPIAVFWKNNCFRCKILTGRPTLSEGIDLFQIFEAGEAKTMYALIRSTNGMKLLPARDVYSFLEEIGLNNRAKLHVPFAAEDMKSSSSTDDFDTFATFVAKSREKKFLAYLKNIGYDATTMEKVSDFFKHLIPFYSCAESIQDTDTTKQTAAMACIVDSIVVIPVFGLLTSTSAKFTTVTMRSTFLNLAIHMEKFTLSEVIKSIIKIGVRVVALDVAKIFSQIITKEFIKTFSIAILRSLDPGIEFSYILTKAGLRTIMKGWKFLKNKSSVKFFSNLKGATSVKIGSYNGHDVQVQTITGQDGFGLRKIVVQDKIAELRKVRGYANDMPVVLVNEGKKRKIYKIMDLNTRKLGVTEWEEKAGVLQVADKSLAHHLNIIKTEGLSGRGLVASGIKRRKVREILQERQIEVLSKVTVPSDRETLVKILKDYVLENYENSCRDFVHYWLKFKKVPSSSVCCKLLEPEILYNIRFVNHLEGITLLQSDAIQRIYNIYGHQYVRDVINVDLASLYEFFTSHNLYDAISFRDQFALGNFINSGYSRIHLDDLEALNMKRAFYTTALREYDSASSLFSSAFSNVLYTTQVSLSTDIFPIQEGKIIDINHFTILSSQNNELLPHFNLVQNDILVKVMNKFRFTHHCLTVYLKSYLPFKSQYVVLLPGIQLVLEKWGFEMIEGHKILVMEWKNVILNKSKWLADTANKIKTLNDREKVLLGNDEIIDITD